MTHGAAQRPSAGKQPVTLTRHGVSPDVAGVDQNQLRGGSSTESCSRRQTRGDVDERWRMCSPLLSASMPRVVLKDFGQARRTKKRGP